MFFLFMFLDATKPLLLRECETCDEPHSDTPRMEEIVP